MKIKIKDFLNVIWRSSSIPELKIKCNLTFGADFYELYKKILSTLGYKIDDYAIYTESISGLRDVLDGLMDSYYGKYFHYPEEILVDVD